MTIHYRHFYATSTFTAWDQLLDETEAEAKVVHVMSPCNWVGGSHVCNVKTCDRFSVTVCVLCGLAVVKMIFAVSNIS